MASPLLATKFHVPTPRSTLVERARLAKCLDAGRDAKLTLISAPAGFGKTTLLAEWMAEARAGGRVIAWLSLDQRDNDPAVFWTYVGAALHRAIPALGDTSNEALASSPSNAEAIVGGLSADLDAADNDLILVLDDYHVIDTTEVQEGLAFLINHLPPHLQVVIGTRTDPRLPLARLRARGELVEIRAADLRFTPEEAAAYLTGSMGLALTPADVGALEARTEGWIVALQLAALSLQGREDSAGFIETFAGDDRFVVDYLVEEVLQRQPDQVRGFLQQTSILTGLTGALCDAVTGDTDGAAMLATLERSNLFVVPLDDQRRWYRYHHLFADMLAARLRAEAPDSIAELHRRASEWYEANDNLPDAIRHAMLADNPTRAGELIEQVAPTMFRDRQEATVRAWLDALPTDVVRARPELAIHYVGSHVVSGDFAGIEPYLDAAEQSLVGYNGPDTPIIRTIPGMVFAYRAAIAQSRGDMAGAAAHARRAYELAHPDDHLARGAAAGLSGLASWTIGDLAAARESWIDSLASLDRANHVADAMGGSLALTDILIAQGRLSEAAAVFEQRLALAARSANPTERGVGDMHVGFARILCERGDLAGAKEHLDANTALGDPSSMPQNAYRARVAAAHVAWAEGDLAGAIELLDDAERVYIGDFFPMVRPIPAIRARVLVAQGKEADALAWARARGLTVNDDLTYLTEYEHTTLALVAHGRRSRDESTIPDALRLLERLRAAAEAGERNGSLIEILAIQTLAYQAQGNMPDAVATLRTAVTLAEPEGYVTTFACLGDHIVGPLKGLAKEGTAPAYVRTLLAAIAAGGDAPQREQGLIELLSERELDVLRLLRSELSGPEIARELFVSLNTVRTHTKSIFMKLGVTNRRAAVRAAEELGL